ncbi:MAG: hydrogenase 4 subunit F [Candidatus Dormibacteraeota bacterium]|nr:hydrogenase 4 subunit F [Candidatus Dormibacteraeota bacterium]
MSGTLIVALLAIPLIGALLSWRLRSTVLLHAVAGVTHILVLACALALLTQLLRGSAPHLFGGWLVLDHLGGLVLLIVACVGFTAAIYSIGYMGHELSVGAIAARDLSRYYLLFHVFVFTMLVASVAGNLGLLWTAIAGTTIASAPLVDFFGSRDPLEAAWKYILLTTAGSMIALFGFLVLYQAGVHLLGRSYDFSFLTLAAVAPRLPAEAAAAAFVLVLVGLGAKAGLAPMHSWLPDAHSQAPSPICALLSGVELNCAMLGILRVFELTAPAAGASRLRFGLLLLGLVSVAVGVVFLVSQRDFKRLLAYSSIEQMGLVAVGVGLGVPLAVFGGLLQMVNHAFTKSLMFFGTGNLLLRFETRTMTSVSGVVRLMPVTAMVTLAGALAIGGAPPFSLFVSEFSIVAGAASSRQWIPTVLVASLLVVGFLAILWPFNRMVFSNPARQAAVAESEINAFTLVPAVVSLAVIVLLGVWVPGPLRDLLAGAARGLAP